MGTYMTKRFFTGLLLMGFACLVLIAGCTVGPDYDRPDLNIPSKWKQPQQQGNVIPVELKQWWTVLDDPVLDSLIERAGRGNPDLKVALFHIDESRAMRDYSAGFYSPRVDFNARYSKIRDTENTVFSYPGQPIDPYDMYSVGFDASWEIDLFGQIKRSVESAQASFQAAIDNYNDVMITLFAEVARNYVELRTIQERLRYTRQNIKSQRDTLKLTEDRFKAGLTPELDVVQARLNLANTESEVPALLIAKSQGLNRIAVLLGLFPQDFGNDLSDAKALPDLSDQLGVSLPADLLRRRPDIRRAERQLAAQTAKIGVATADLYPSFTLTGTFNLQASKFSQLGHMSSHAYSFGPDFRWYILGGDRVRSTIRVEEARTEQAAIAYENAVLLAVEEAENAMTAYYQENQRRQALERSVDASLKSVQLVESLYKNGLTDFQNVLDMQRTLFIQQDKLASSRGQVVINLIRIYKAIGGGWSPEDLEEQEDTEQNSDAR